MHLLESERFETPGHEEAPILPHDDPLATPVTWDARHSGAPRADADPWLRGLAPAFAAGIPGPPLDAACGLGQNTLWLASLVGAAGGGAHGVDASPVAVSRAREAAALAGLPASFEVWDLEAAGLPPGPWGAVVLLHFLDRRLFAGLAASVVPGGLLACKTHLAHPLRPPGSRPRRAEHLLRPGELLEIEGFAPLDYREVARPEGSWAGLLARRTGAHSR